MPLMATSSSGDALQASTGLRTLLPHQFNKHQHDTSHSASFPVSIGLLQRQQRHGRGDNHRPQVTCPLTAPFQPFPADRYKVLYAYEAPMHSRAMQRQHAAVATDLRDRQRILLTSFHKASVTEWQLAHIGHVLATLEREPKVFQRLLQVWDAGSSWVVVQQTNPKWMPLRDYFKVPAKFSEERLRQVVFQVAAMVHFLHRHELSLAGELVHYDLVMTNKQVTLLLHLDLILSGCILVPATKRNRDADIAAIGMLMFQVAMMPCSPRREVDIRYVEGSIEEQLAHLSSPCRELLLDCLTMKLSVKELLTRKWLRQVDFLSTTHRPDNSLSNAGARSALYRSLIWKLAAFCMLDWLRRSRHTPEVQHTDEEETESSRQNRNKRPARRMFTRSRLYVPNGVLRRGPLPIPVPSGHLLLQQGGADAIDENPADQRRHLHNIPQELPHEEEVDTKTWSMYDEFGYDFPSVYTNAKPLYDTFGFDDELTREDDGGDEFISLPNEEGRPSLTSSPASDGRELQREVVRSLQHDGAVWNGNSDATSVYTEALRSHEKSRSTSLSESVNGQFEGDRRRSHDAVHFSAFGPAQIEFCESFRIDIWAYLKQQRETMLETALEHNDVECGQRVQPLQIERGTLVTVSIEPSVRFGIAGEDCKSFRWRGDITGVSFDLFRVPCQEDDGYNDELCIAKIVAGTKVSLLYIRLQTGSRDVNVRKDSDMTLLEAHMEHVQSNLQDIPGDELELIRPIGHGAFGDAVLARWKSTSQNVVVKMMHQDAYRSSDALAELHHEAEVMNLLGKHPHVVELIGVNTSGIGSSNGVGSPALSLVTEYLPNGSVEDVLGMNSLNSDGNLGFDLFSRTIMARDAAHGLANIHQGNFLHRDIAARNCLVDAQFRVKVSDFGLARRLHGVGSSSFLFDDNCHGFGPLKWMAPESMTPPHLFSTYSDSYMFGVLLYEIFSGHAPFPNLSARDAAALILEGHHVPIPSSLPTAHRKLMEQCFDVHPLRRPTMDQIYSTLDHWVLQDTKTHVKLAS